MINDHNAFSEKAIQMSDIRQIAICIAGKMYT